MLKEKLDTLKAKVSYFQINLIIIIKGGDNLKFINGKIYEYVINNSIIVYDSITFKQIGILKLPFERQQPSMDILENDVLIIMGNSNLYFYKIDLKENKLIFLHYISDIYNFCYLKKRKEIFLLTEVDSYTEKKEIWGMARADLLGNIIYYNKTKPEIHYEYKPPSENDNMKLITRVQYDYENFNKFDGFNNDKYIINVSGYFNDWFDYSLPYGETEIRSDISVFDGNNLNEIFYEKHYYIDNGYNDQYCHKNKDDEQLLDYVKISDNLFKYLSKEGVFYYNEKENKIENIYNFFDYISKSFQSYYKNKKKYDELQLLQLYKEYNKYLSYYHTYNRYYKLKHEYESKTKFNYFYFDDNTFGIFVNAIRKYYLYIIYLSEGNIKKISLNCLNDINENLIIINIFYSKGNEKENIYFFVSDKNKKKIIHGIVYDENKELQNKRREERRNRLGRGFRGNRRGRFRGRGCSRGRNIRGNRRVGFRGRGMRRGSRF